MDIFERCIKNMGPIGQYSKVAYGYYVFPQLEGEIGTKMQFMGKDRLVWSLNNYLGLANHPEVRKADADAAAKYGMAAPMGARALTGQTKYHAQLEQEFADFERKEAAYLFNFGYQGITSTIDALLDRNDVVVYDAECHACIIDGLRLHVGKRFVYKHNDMESCEKQLQRATKLVEQTGGGIMVITEGVYGMSGNLGQLDKIVELKTRYDFRLLIDDAHGFGVMGKDGRGTSEHFDVMDGVDVYCATFAKSMAGIGGFVASNKEIIEYLTFNLRSQIYAKSLPLAMTIGALKRMELIRNHPELRTQLWTVVKALQEGLRERGFNIGITKAPVTPVFLNGTVAEATNMVYEIREVYNIFCSVVVYPVIPKGQIILRLIPTAVHTLDDVNYTLDVFGKVKHKLDSGEYARMDIKQVKI